MVITRIAPSPTGSLHIGTLRTALFSYAWAKKNKGKFLLRIEDTDQSRLVPGTEEEIEEMLKIYGLDYDEKSKQTERKDIYKRYAEELVQLGQAYYCFATKEEIQEAREIAENSGEQFRFRSPFRDFDIDKAKERIASGEPFVIRLKVAEGEEFEFEDLLQGKMHFKSEEVDDTVLLKSDGLPTYHLAVVIDDHLMGITHVMRGVDWVPSIPKHVLIHRAFNWEMPKYLHLPLVLDPEGGKLSKRKGTVAAKDFLIQGYLPEAILNFLMLLGWSSPIKHEFGEKEREIFSLEEFIELFELKDLNKSSAVFNREKLLWFNHQYIMSFSIDELHKRYSKWHAKYSEEKQLRLKIAEKGDKYLKEVLELVHDRVKLLSEIDELIRIFYFEPEKIEFSEFKQIKNLSDEQVSVILKSVVKELEKKSENLDDWPHEKWEEFMRNLAEENGLGAGKVFMTLRLAITSSPATPPLYEIMTILGKSEILTRLSKYVDNI